MKVLELGLRSQRLGLDEGEHNDWRVRNEVQAWPCTSTGLLLCDVWDCHWSRGATERVDGMVPRMNRVVKKARSLGVQIIHAPSDSMEFYADTEARQRILGVPVIDPPPDLEHDDPPQPVDSSDGGSDTREPDWHKAWMRQHPGIEIDYSRDVISDNGREVFSFMTSRKIDRLLIMGVHTNMCVLGRSFAIKQMVRWGKRVALVRDLTDAMYNPAKPPYVGHWEGTRLIVEFIEKFWCPTVLSEDILNS
ncbi:MAG: isochorismatase family protein [Gemmatimonadetes bacterium]|jgi:nicotinamidase-related amidase|nr:isochorismatase family protein [Gemmatimonadota bacterium]